MTAEFKTWQAKRHARIRRTKQLLKWMPRRGNLHRYPILKWFAAAARKRPYLWSFKRSSCTPAIISGSIITFLPLVGIQIPLAFLTAFALRANLPILIALQGISNPLPVPFLCPAYYLRGKRVMAFLNFGQELNPILRNLNATFIGGAIIGIVVGLSLDLLYRFMVYETRKHNERRTPPLEEPGKTASYRKQKKADRDLVTLPPEKSDEKPIL